MDRNELIAELRRALGPRGVVAEADNLRTYDADASMIVSHPPELVALPATPEQAAEVVRLAAAAGLPVVARGAGTGIAGGAVPVRGGVVLSTARLDGFDLRAIEGGTLVVGAGVVNAELNAALAPLGLQFAPDPSSQRASTIGGNLATNAGGPHCLKHGVTANHIRAVELVRPDGALAWTGDGAPDAAGYDLTGLVVGSEGTFGVVTRARVRLSRLPEANRVMLALFPSVVAASAAVSHVIAAGSLPTSLEVMDHNAIRAVNGAYGLGLPEAEGTTLLIIEVDGVADGLDDALEEILDTCREAGAFELRPARTAAEQARVWVARKSVAGAIGRLAPAYLLVDTVVPRTRLPLMMEHVERLRHEHAMEVCNVFHAGDGNLHPLILYDPRDADQRRRAHVIAKGVLELSIAQGGVISGEHGIGVEKQEYLPLLFSRAELQLQAAVYHVFNPDERFNPAKIFPAADRPAELAAERAVRLGTRGRGDEGTRGRVGEGEPALLISGLVPDEVAVPGSVDELAAAVAACHRAGVAVVPWGGGTRQSAGNGLDTGGRPLAVISTARLRGVLQYEPDDLTICVEAGMPLAELQALLAANGQMLPLDVARPERATVGGLVATAAEGPRREGYGLMRDWVLALSVVEADGAVSRLGAQVVKNVTGYDLVKLFVGSHGTLGVIASVALRVFPRPRASATLLAPCPDLGVAGRLVAAIGASRLQPTAAELLHGLPAAEGAPWLLAARAEGSPAAVERHMEELARLAADAGGGPGQVVTGAAEEALWSAVAAQADHTVGPGEALVRVAHAPGAPLFETLGRAAALAEQTGVRAQVAARALSGVALFRLAGTTAALAELCAGLSSPGRHVHLLAAPPALRDAIPTWGRPPAALDLMRELKAALDPHNTLNPGRFVV